MPDQNETSPTQAHPAQASSAKAPSGASMEPTQGERRIEDRGVLNTLDSLYGSSLSGIDRSAATEDEKLPEPTGQGKRESASPEKSPAKGPVRVTGRIRIGRGQPPAQARDQARGPASQVTEGWDGKGQGTKGPNEKDAIAKGADAKIDNAPVAEAVAEAAAEAVAASGTGRNASLDGEPAAAQVGRMAMDNPGQNFTFFQPDAPTDFFNVLRHYGYRRQSIIDHVGRKIGNTTNEDVYYNSDEPDIDGPEGESRKIIVYGDFNISSEDSNMSLENVLIKRPGSSLKYRATPDSLSTALHDHYLGYEDGYRPSPIPLIECVAPTAYDLFCSAFELTRNPREVKSKSVHRDFREDSFYVRSPVNSNRVALRFDRTETGYTARIAEFSQSWKRLSKVATLTLDASSAEAHHDSAEKIFLALKGVWERMKAGQAAIVGDITRSQDEIGQEVERLKAVVGDDPSTERNIPTVRLRDSSKENKITALRREGFRIGVSARGNVLQKTLSSSHYMEIRGVDGPLIHADLLSVSIRNMATGETRTLETSSLEEILLQPEYGASAVREPRPSESSPDSHRASSNEPRQADPYPKGAGPIGADPEDPNPEDCGTSSPEAGGEAGESPAP